MKKLSDHSVPSEPIPIDTISQGSVALPALLGTETSHTLQRMFRDPRVLNAGERSALVAQLQNAVELEPSVPEIRVLYGMALSVDLQVQESLEQLRESARCGPDCFIAHLKFGELLMRLRICTQAAEETQKAAELAANAFQSDLARRQATAIRTMLREGVERGGYKAFLPNVLRFRRKSASASTATVLVGSK